MALSALRGGAHGDSESCDGSVSGDETDDETDAALTAALSDLFSALRDGEHCDGESDDKSVGAVAPQWRVVLDELSSRPYFMDSTTGEVAWVAGLEPPPPATAASSTGGEPNPGQQQQQQQPSATTVCDGDPFLASAPTPAMEPQNTNTEAVPLVILNGGSGGSSRGSDYGRCSGGLGPRSPPDAANSTGGVVHDTLPRA